MKGLGWDDFHQQAQTSICKECTCGATAPWRGNATCLQAWLRFHSSRGIILACHASRSGATGSRPEHGLMADHSPLERVVVGERR
jgi:hypothetical protein